MPVSEHVVCAVDGGGTITLAIVMDRDGIEYGRASTGPSNYVAGEAERVVSNVTAAVEHAVRIAGRSLPIDTLSLIPISEPTRPY
mgnify:CR=1 FL=1